MRPINRIAALAVAVAVVAAGCGSDDEVGATNDTGGLPQGSEEVSLDPADFTTHIDNPWWPMVPGTRWSYRETDQEGSEQEVEVTVTTETKRIANGVTARVVRDTVTEQGKVVEDTFDWYAQDREGNIWYLGEDTKEFEGGKVSSTSGSFEAGVDGAQPGIIMPADPAVGLTYRQEYYKGEAEDNGKVLSLDEMAEVPYGRFDRALLTRDTITIEPDVLEYKLYARDVGPVMALGVSGGPGSREELIEVGKVDSAEAKAAATDPLGSRR